MAHIIIPPFLATPVVVLMYMVSMHDDSTTTFHGNNCSSSNSYTAVGVIHKSLSSE